MPAGGASQAPASDGPQEKPDHGVYGVIGLGAFAIAGSGNFSPGGTLRAGVGYRFDRNFSLGILGDVGVASDSRNMWGTRFQAWTRLCAESAFTLPLSSVGLHAGPHLCGVYTRRRVGGIASGLGRSIGLADWLAGYAFGGFIGVSFALEGSMRLWVRADVDALALEKSSFGSVPWSVLPALSVLLSW